MRLAWLLTATALIAGAVRAEPMTYDQALARAHANAPSLRAKGLRVDAARSDSLAAGALPDPRLSFGLDNFPISGPPAGRLGADEMTGVRLGFVQDMPSLAKRRARVDSASAMVAQAQAAVLLEDRVVRLGAALAWIDLYYAERRLAVLDDIVRKLQPLRDTAASRVTSGSSRPGQTVEIDQLLAALGDRRSDLLAQVAKARAELVRWTGDPDAEVAGDPPTFEVDEVALRAGLGNHPLLLAYDAEGRQADANLGLARADKRPDWSFEMSYQHRDPGFGDMVSVGGSVSLPLFSKNRQDPVITARAADVTRVRLEKDAAARQLLAALEADLADHRMHHERMMRAHETLVPLAQKRADLETASYAAGTATLGDVLAAFMGLAEARLDALDREAEVARDAVRINLTYGADQ
jgi:cobalt-zinc-cadmium efflux system outer membrane protein